MPKKKRKPPYDENGYSWRGIVAMESTPTGDGRMLAPGSIRWDRLPVPLRWVKEDGGAHEGAVVVGRVLSMWREGSAIWAAGDFDDGSPEGLEAFRQVDENLTRGVSLDLDDVDLELRMTVHDELSEEEGVMDESGRVIVDRKNSGDEIYVTMDGRTRALTIVAKPAFAEAQIVPVDLPESSMRMNEDEENYDGLVASAKSRPPRAWFANPKLGRPTPFTVTDEGRVYGHIALWGTCHTGFANECVSPPKSQSNYAHFMFGEVLCDDGATVPAGKITMDTTHAGRRLSASDTASHYEHTGLTAAMVSAGDDSYGVWVAGCIHPSLSEDQLATLRLSPMSGDWRRIAGNLELRAVLAVNTPGFPVPRALVASGRVEALQSAGSMHFDGNFTTELQEAPGGGLPDAYRPASSEDVPDGQACGNCAFFVESEQDEAGNSWCSWWEDWVQADAYCDAWVSADEEPDEADSMTAALSSDQRTPTEGMAEEAQRALDWRSEGFEGGEENTARRARSIAAREPLASETIRRMHAFFSRNARYPELDGFSPGDDGYPSRARVAWGLWGGDAGASWSSNMVEEMGESSLSAAAVGDVEVGSFVEWSWSGGTAQGEVQEIVTEGQLEVPGTDVVINADEDDPAVLIESWSRAETDDGDFFEPTGSMVGRRMSSLTVVDPLEQNEEVQASGASRDMRSVFEVKVRRANVAAKMREASHALRPVR